MKILAIFVRRDEKLQADIYERNLTKILPLQPKIQQKERKYKHRKTIAERGKKNKKDIGSKGDHKGMCNVTKDWQ